MPGLSWATINNQVNDPVPYQRHRPEQMLLYRLIEHYYPEFQSQLDESGGYLPGYVKKEFTDYLECGRLEHGFLRVRCESCPHERLVAFSCKHRGFCPSCAARRMAETAALLIDDVLPYQPMRQWVLSVPIPLRFLFASHPSVMGQVLGIINRAISTFIIKKAGYNRQSASTGAVTLIQRFGSALNLNTHFHMLFLDGVYTQAKGTRDSVARFHRIPRPGSTELNKLVHTISQRIARHLERHGYLTQDEEISSLSLDLEENDSMHQLQNHSITYRIAVGPKRGRKVFSLQTLPCTAEEEPGNNRVGYTGGFSLHAGVATEAHQRDKLERLCRTISRPALSGKRLARTAQGKIRYELKTPYSDGTTHVIFEPLDFIAKLAALVPKPRVNLTRYHGVFAPNSKLRSAITPAKRGKGNRLSDRLKAQEPTVQARHKNMSWAQRLKRVFGIDISTCTQCGGKVRIVACIENPVIIRKILDHLDKKQIAPIPFQLPLTRASPQPGLF